MLLELIKEYLDIFPDERTNLGRLIKQCTAHEVLDDRNNFNGHLTASGIVLAPDKRQVLLIHHKAYDVWQQPGGHVDPGEQLKDAAEREVMEETGVNIDIYEPLDSKNPAIPFDIDSHPVPARPEKNEPAHWHHDVRFVFIARSTDIRPQLSEIVNVDWFAIDAPETDRVKKVLAKLRQREIIA